MSTPLPSRVLGPTELEFATFHEGYLSRYIQLADAKAGSVLVVVAAAIGYLLSQDRLVTILHGDVAIWRVGLLVVTLLALGGSGALAFHVIAPRQPSSGNSLIYYGDAAALSEITYIEAVHTAGPDGLARQRLAHAHALTGICRDKYRWLRRAMLVGAAGLIGAFLCRIVL